MERAADVLVGVVGMPMALNAGMQSPRGEGFARAHRQFKEF